MIKNKIKTNSRFSIALLKCNKITKIAIINKNIIIDEEKGNILKKLPFLKYTEAKLAMKKSEAMRKPIDMPIKAAPKKLILLLDLSTLIDF